MSRARRNNGNGTHLDALALADGLIDRAMLKEKKVELDRRIEAANDVISEYRATFSDNVLTDERIDTTVRDLEALNEELERLGALTFAQRRALIERMSISGRIEIDNGWQVLRLFVFNIRIDDITMREVSHKMSDGIWR